MARLRKERQKKAKLYSCLGSMVGAKLDLIFEDVKCFREEHSHPFVISVTPFPVGF